uniref:Uncharacterized protein n=1 Tax=Setaria italica TaxID=4555 RepID=K4ANL5_SETIT
MVRSHGENHFILGWVSSGSPSEVPASCYLTTWHPKHHGWFDWTIPNPIVSVSHDNFWKYVLNAFLYNSLLGC